MEKTIIRKRKKKDILKLARNRVFLKVAKKYCELILLHVVIHYM